MARLRYRVDELGRLVEVPPDVLDCGHRCGPLLMTVGYLEHPQHPGVRVRCYYCRTCRTVTFTEPN